MYSTYSRYSSGAVLPQSPTPYPASFSHYFERKGTPFVYLVIDKWYPFHILTVELCIPFNCCKYTVSYEQIRKQLNKVFSTFSKPRNTSVSPFGPFYRPRYYKFSYPFVKTVPFHIPEV